MPDSQPKPSRRGFMFAAAATGAAAATVAALPKSPEAAVEAAVAEPVKAPANGGGYHESAHVKHYYQTTRI